MRMTMGRSVRWLSALVVLLCATPAWSQTKICVDPGHGGDDPGAIGCGLQEATINLDVSLRLRDLLQAAGYQVYMTRSTDTSVSLTGRANYANSNGAARFASIHCNSASVSSATGTETFHATNASSKSIDQANRIQSEMIATWGLANRGVKSANFTVLTATSMPATLSELGFIVNCSVDASYLAQPERRQAAALAHLRALQLSLGDPIGPGTGEARGVVFEDLGVGSDDMSVRLPGATITVVETGQSVQATEPSAAWTLSLPPGNYTLRAQAPGYQSNQRSCTVLANDIAWCSIGLFKEVVEPDPELEPDPEPELEPDPELEPQPDSAELVDEEPDLSQDLWEPFEPSPDGEDVALDLSPELDQNSEISEENDVAEATPAPTLSTESACGCGLSKRAPSVPWLLLLLPAIFLLRRRGALLIGLGLLAIPVPGQAEAPVLQELELVASGYQAPLLSDSGELLLLGSEDLGRLYVMPSRGGDARLLVEQTRAAYMAEWMPEDAGVALRLPARPFADEPWLAYELDGKFQGPYSKHAEVAVFQSDDQVVLRLGKVETVLARDDDRYFEPQLSPDGRFVLYSGLSSGLWLMRLDDGRRFSLGKTATQGRFSANGERLVFARVEDDGQALTGSALFLLELEQPEQVFELRTPEGLMPLYPSLDAEGGRIVFSTADAKVYRGQLK